MLSIAFVIMLFGHQRMFHILLLYVFGFLLQVTTSAIKRASKAKKKAHRLILRVEQFYGACMVCQVGLAKLLFKFNYSIYKLHTLAGFDTGFLCKGVGGNVSPRRDFQIDTGTCILVY